MGGHFFCMKTSAIVKLGYPLDCIIHYRECLCLKTPWIFENCNKIDLP